MIRAGMTVSHKGVRVRVAAVRYSPIRYAELVDSGGRKYTAPLSELEMER